MVATSGWWHVPLVHHVLLMSGQERSSEALALLLNQPELPG